MTPPAAEALALCPSDDEVLALVCGNLGAGARSRLLRHAEGCPACTLVVAEAGLALEPPLDQAPQSDAARGGTVFTPGQLVGSRYLIERRLGQGGMGEVYAALDQELEERVALKTIAPSLSAEPRAVPRLKLELRLARRVSHPHVCRVYELGRHERADGSCQWFITLQLIDGLSLRRRLVAEGTPAVELALTWAEQLAGGLAAIHAQSVVHRDIKPENVMLAPPVQPTTALWVDFGLARADLRDTSSPGLLQGTPAYTAPELLAGAVASRASDIYAFGVLLYELLTGALPFPISRARTPAKEADRPAPPSALRPELDPELDALVLQCLDDEPVRRPESAAQLAEELCALRHARAERAAAVRPRRRFWRTSWWLIGAVAALIVAAFVLPRGSMEMNAAPSRSNVPMAAPESLESPPTIASTPPSPIRAHAPTSRNLVRRPPAPAPVTPPAEPPAPIPPPVTDFGGRR